MKDKGSYIATAGRQVAGIVKFELLLYLAKIQHYHSNFNAFYILYPSKA